MRDMRAARAKVCEEGKCRNCHRTGDLDPAHAIPRSRLRGEEGAEDPRNIIPMCRRCHDAQHAGLLFLGALLTPEERAYVIDLVGEGEAEVRLYGRVL